MQSTVPTPFNMAAYVLEAGQAHPERIALQILRLTGAERWSYAALTEAVRGTGTGLLEVGLQPGERLLLRLGNTVDFPIAYLGAIAVGIIPVPSSSQLTVSEITALSATLEPAAILAEEGIALPDHPARVIPVSELRGWRKRAPCAYEMGAPDRLAYMVFTSGTSGRPRAVMHAHRAVWARRMMWEGWEGLTSDDRLIHAGAFNWTYTLGTGLMDPWALGATALIPAPGLTPAQLPHLMKRFDATIFAAAPGVYRQMLRADLPALPRLRHGLSAGEALPKPLAEQWKAATGTEIYEAYGMSEVSTFLSSSPARPAPEGYMGFAQTGRSLAVLDPEGRALPEGEAGELAVSRQDPGLFLGYWNAPEETAARLTEQWYLTGDSVVAGPNGAYRVLGRMDDMLNAGGYRVSPREIEAAFEAHEGVIEAAAIAVEVREGVEVIALGYRPDPANPPSEPALADWAEQHLARYKQPRLYRALDDLPRGANNKLNRRLLRQSWSVS